MGVISRDVFVKVFSVSLAILGFNVAFMTEQFGKASFNDFVITKEVLFMCRLLGVAAGSASAANWAAAETDAGYWISLASTIGFILCGPVNIYSRKILGFPELFDTKLGHKLESILLWPTLIILAALAY